MLCNTVWPQVLGVRVWAALDAALSRSRDAESLVGIPLPPPPSTAGLFPGVPSSWRPSLILMVTLCLGALGFQHRLHAHTWLGPLPLVSEGCRHCAEQGVPSSRGLPGTESASTLTCSVDRNHFLVSELKTSISSSGSKAILGSWGCPLPLAL